MLIQSVAVRRSPLGYWTHPNLPSLISDESWQDWLDLQRLELKRVVLADESEDHPAFVLYFAMQGRDISTWNPVPPVGHGWFLLAIRESPRGPQALFVRRPPRDMSMRLPGVTHGTD